MTDRDLQMMTLFLGMIPMVIGMGWLWPVVNPDAAFALGVGLSAPTTIRVMARVMQNAWRAQP